GDGLLFYVMPFIAGESLRARMTRERQLPIDDAIRITCEVADALDYAHRHGLIHRDIKPENILLEDGHAIVADFGIARAVSAGTDQQKLTESGITLGTPLYMSPEQAMGERDLDGRSDQYSLACVLYEMLAGGPPFSGQSAHALIARHLLDPVPSLLTVRDTVPDEVETAITCALAKVPADRFATVAAFSAALRGTGTFPVTRRSTLGRTGTRRVVRSRRPAIILGATALLFVGGAAGGWALWRRPTTVASAAANELDPRRIAVLYFDDQSREGELAYLADALSESLIEQLDAVGALDVISKNGVVPLKGKPVNVDSVARQLRAGTLVRGTVEDEGDHIRLTVRLVDGNSGADFRRASFAQPKGNVLAARDSLATQVAIFLRERLGEEVRLREARSGTRNADAWSLVQQAEKARKDADALAAADSAAASARKLALADSLLARAEVLDSKWATPVVQRTWLAYREQRGVHDPLRKRDIINRGIGHAERALTIDPRNAEAFEARGALRYFKHVQGLATDPTEAADLLRLAEEDLRQSTSLDPGKATAWNTLSFLLYRKYNRVEANLAAQRAYAADAYLTAAPDILFRLYATSWDMEQFVEAAKWCDLGHRRFPENHLFTLCQLWLLSTNVRQPDPAKAWQLLDELEQLTPASRREMVRRAWQMVVALSIDRAGHPDSARRVIERARAGRDIDPRGELLGQELVVRAMLGDNEEALRVLKVYLTSHPEHREGFTKANRWEFRALRNDPRYLALVGTH
ncbi:MAG: serine/threonine-protein kinase, partial [Gemmatimonadota bacterium]|nr:serine/threonine-protein kinase [Gemmatimonadota bacterium]